MKPTEVIKHNKKDIRNIINITNIIKHNKHNNINKTLNKYAPLDVASQMRKTPRVI